MLRSLDKFAGNVSTHQSMCGFYLTLDPFFLGHKINVTEFLA
jgi:hypothetical protein